MNVQEDDSNLPPPDDGVPPAARGHLLAYLLPMLVVPVLLLLAAFAVVPTRWFALHSGNTYLANMAWGTTLHNADCQILIYGDSGALTDINPMQLQQRTGLSACNMAEFEGMTAVNGTKLVDSFLQNNPRPRFMVFLYAPEYMREQPHWNQLSSFEAVTYRMGHYRNLETLGLILQHPVDVLGWAEQGMRMALQRIHSQPLPQSQLGIRDATHGFFHPSGEAMTQCDAIKHERPPDPEWLSNLRSRYAREGTQVIINITPSPACDATLPFLLAHMPQGVDDRSPYPIYPVTDYLQGFRMHMTYEGSAKLTDMVAAQILERMGQNAPARSAAADPAHGGS